MSSHTESETSRFLAFRARIKLRKCALIYDSGDSDKKAASLTLSSGFVKNIMRGSISPNHI
jgi:hypothetical protein